MVDANHYFLYYQPRLTCRRAIMKLVTQKSKISQTELKQMAAHLFGDLVKAVVDIEKEVMLVDAELHADEEADLIQSGSLQKNLWGINLYPDLDNVDWIEFDSMINLRPSQNNVTRSVDDTKTQVKIRKIVAELVEK